MKGKGFMQGNNMDRCPREGTDLLYSLKFYLEKTQHRDVPGDQRLRLRFHCRAVGLILVGEIRSSCHAAKQNQQNNNKNLSTDNARYTHTYTYTSTYR